MKILNRHELMALEERVLFAEIHPNDLDLEGLYVYEGDIDKIDFVSTNITGLFPQKKGAKGSTQDDLELIIQGKDFEIDLESSTRDGMYDDKMRYAVYEKTDLLKLINKLQGLYIENFTE